jgi:ribokinase
VSRLDLIGCGALNLDLIYRLPDSFPLWDQLPARGSEEGLTEALRAQLDEALITLECHRSGGGQAANVVYALRRLGFAAAMLGRVGEDDDGSYLCDDLGRDAARYVARQGQTGRVYVLLDESGERRNLVWPAANDQFSPADLPRRLPHARVAYFTSFVGEEPLQAQLQLLQRLSKDVDVAFDPGELYARRGVKRFMPLLQRTTYLFATETELELMCGVPLEEAISFMLNVGVGLVVCKMGVRGARLVARRGEMYIPPSPVEVVDVTGAGDLFAAGFLAALLRDMDLESAGHLAAWAAAQGIGGFGRSAYPDAAAWRERVTDEQRLRESGEAVRGLQ